MLPSGRAWGAKVVGGMHGPAHLLKAEQPADCGKLVKEPGLQPLVIREKVPRACRQRARRDGRSAAAGSARPAAAAAAGKQKQKHRLPPPGRTARRVEVDEPLAAVLNLPARGLALLHSVGAVRGAVSNAAGGAALATPSATPPAHLLWRSLFSLNCAVHRAESSPRRPPEQDDAASEPAACHEAASQPRHACTVQPCATLPL